MGTLVVGDMGGKQPMAPLFIGEGDFTFTDSYLTGGEALDWVELIPAQCTLLEVRASNHGGYAFEYDYDNKKLKAFRCAGDNNAMEELPDTTDISVTPGAIKVIAIGY